MREGQLLENWIKATGSKKRLLFERKKKNLFVFPFNEMVIKFTG